MVSETTATAAEEKPKKEGENLLGSPTFTELGNGRFKCVESGHEVLAKDIESYSRSKRCRLGLIEFGLTNNKIPLNMFKQDPLSCSKLQCKLTGDTINKSEEHIWKHINGKRFLNKLEQKELKKVTPNGPVEEQVEQKPGKTSKSNIENEKKKKKKKKKKDKTIEAIISEVREPSIGDSDQEDDEVDGVQPSSEDFWMPPLGERWDFDDGGDRWGSGSDSEEEGDEVDGMEDAVEDDGKESDELSTRTKRMSIEMGPSSFASRKKKNKKNPITET